ncbi:MAG: cytidine deaminase [Streptococcaceae bacterium]|nr:cytidine deaminase [Streptococcaceae bacterium]
MATTDLAALAKKASEAAYVPYSHFRVGAVLESSDGRLFTGCNIENISFGLTNCAERTAIFKAISEGVREFKSLTIYGETKDPISPCGACRQVLSEFCPPEMSVTLLSSDLTAKTMTLGELLPYRFTDLD